MSTLSAGIVVAPVVGSTVTAGLFEPHSPVAGSLLTTTVCESPFSSVYTTVTSVVSSSAGVTTTSPSIFVSMVGASGAVVSTVTVAVSVSVLPAGSVAVTVMVCSPSFSVGKVSSASVQVPSPLLVAG